MVTTTTPVLLWRSIDPVVKRVGWALLLAIFVFGAVHVVHALTGAVVAFNLDQEKTGPAIFSALLLAAGGLAFLSAVLMRRTSRWTTPLALLLLLMAGDEFLLWHESLERSTGVDWQVLYAPIILAGGASALLVLWRLRGGVAAAFLGLGCFAWAVSQVLEALQWDGDRINPGYRFMMPLEEVLEMGGSALFLLAALSILRAQHPDGWHQESQATDGRPATAVHGGQSITSDVSAP